MKFVRFPDGVRFSSQTLVEWFAAGGATGNVKLAAVGWAAGSYYTYTAANDAVAALIVSLMDTWFVGPDNAPLDIASALGMTVSSISPASGSHSGTFTITLTGAMFTHNMQVTIGGVVFPATYSSATSISISYANQLTAGTYDVTAQVLPGKNPTFTLPGALVLS